MENVYERESLKDSAVNTIFLVSPVSIPLLF